MTPTIVIFVIVSLFAMVTLMKVNQHSQELGEKVFKMLKDESSSDSEIILFRVIQIVVSLLPAILWFIMMVTFAIDMIIAILIMPAIYGMYLTVTWVKSKIK